MQKRPVTIYFDEDLVRLMDETKTDRQTLMNQLLRTYFSTVKPKELDNKIEELRIELSALEHRREVILAEQAKGPSREQVHDEMFRRLYTAFCKRRTDGISPESDLTWITGPRTAASCHALGKQPVEVLTELRMRFEGEQKTLEAYR